MTGRLAPAADLAVALDAVIVTREVADAQPDQ
jgi:hypothetical protein